MNLICMHSSHFLLTYYTCEWDTPHPFFKNTDHIVDVLWTLHVFTDAILPLTLYFSTNFPLLKTTSSYFSGFIRLDIFSNPQRGPESTVMLIFFFTLWKMNSALKTSCLARIKLYAERLQRIKKAREREKREEAWQQKHLLREWMTTW